MFIVKLPVLFLTIYTTTSSFQHHSSTILNYCLVNGWTLIYAIFTFGIDVLFMLCIILGEF